MNFFFRMRALGSAALNMCMVALGGADICFEYGIHAWDIAAGDLIVREAGGVCIDPAGVQWFNKVFLNLIPMRILYINVFSSGGPFDVMSRRVLCASSMELAQELCKQLVQYYPERDWRYVW